MGKKSQRKGAVGELELAKLLRAEGFEIERGGMSFGTVPDLVGLPGIHIEVKRTERLQLSDAMAQAVRDSAEFGDGLPAVFHRRNREGWLVSMRLEDWLRVYQAGMIAPFGGRDEGSGAIVPSGMIAPYGTEDPENCGQIARATMGPGNPATAAERE